MYPHTRHVCTNTWTHVYTYHIYTKKKSFLSLCVETITNWHFLYAPMSAPTKTWWVEIIRCFRGSLYQVRIFRLIPCLVQKGNCPLSVGFEACSTGRNSCLRSPWSRVCKVRLLLLSMLSNCLWVFRSLPTDSALSTLATEAASTLGSMHHLQRLTAVKGPRKRGYWVLSPEGVYINPPLDGSGNITERMVAPGDGEECSEYWVLYRTWLCAC